MRARAYTDLRQARGTDVVAAFGGVVVQVRGTRPRPVPVLARYQPRLLEAAAFAGEAIPHRRPEA